MKKIISNLILFVFLILILLTVILSTIGIETNRFNYLISKKINQTNKNINLELFTIKFKLDIKEMSLFLETIDPRIVYRNIVIPTKNIKVYIDFVSLIKSDPKIKKINLILNQIEIEQLKKISTTLKPSNFTSFIRNNMIQGKINTELEVYLDNNNLFKNFIARGLVSNLKTEIINNLNLSKTNFTFFADKTDILIKNLSGEMGPIEIKEGDIKLKLSSDITLESSFKSNIKYNNKMTMHNDLIKNIKYGKNILSLEADLDNRFSINFDKTYKLKKYDYKSTGKIIKTNLDFEKSLENNFLQSKIKQLTLKNTKIKTNLNSKNNNIVISGKYSLNKSNFLSFNLKNFIEGESLELNLDAEHEDSINLEIINYQKPKNTIANFSINLEKKKNYIKIKKINLTEKNNSISVKGIKFNKDKFLSLKDISVKTNKNGKKNNDFTISYGNKISINGTQFDASNLPKILNQKTANKSLLNINKDIEINFTNIIAPLSENLKNFKLIGKIEKGKFTKISSKGDFGENNFLDISMKEDKINKKKYLEIYSDLTKPLLTEYSFFKGLTGGKLLYTSVIESDNSISKLRIENFKLINAPGVVKLLSLADLGGLADLAEGEGLSFDFIEINMEKDKVMLKLNEVLALGPSISVLMEGYKDQNGLTSLRGTLVPAKTLNKMISKIPVLGGIIIPKEVGEGLFGISFKMKGYPGKIKTTLNPIRTLTPRFIQKIIDRKKKSK
tara:strand:+ start:291 stop:2477 length:2187 start_codon:yes stop_codon:yes gene_type:complete